ncbi:hypothetical protein C6A85_09065, partial [Mycobacterium sp. ITM-2017-0098]
KPAGFPPQFPLLTSGIYRFLVLNETLEETLLPNGLTVEAARAASTVRPFGSRVSSRVSLSTRKR